MLETFIHMIMNFLFTYPPVTRVFQFLHKDSNFPYPHQPLSLSIYITVTPVFAMISQCSFWFASGSTLFRGQLFFPVKKEVRFSVARKKGGNNKTWKEATWRGEKKYLEKSKAVPRQEKPRRRWPPQGLRYPLLSWRDFVLQELRIVLTRIGIKLLREHFHLKAVTECSWKISSFCLKSHQKWHFA